jgi:hypothetical protein
MGSFTSQYHKYISVASAERRSQRAGGDGVTKTFLITCPSDDMDPSV